MTPSSVMALMKLAMSEKATGATDADRSAKMYSSSVFCGEEGGVHSNYFYVSMGKLHRWPKKFVLGCVNSPTARRRNHAT